MGFHVKIIAIFFRLGLCAALLSCSGATSGGAGGTHSEVGGAAVLGGGNSLDGINTGPGGNVLPGGGSFQGQAQPSTQQAEPGLHAPCQVHFLVTVKVKRNGLEQSCREGDMAAARRIAIEETMNGGTTAPPADPVPGPEVLMNFSTPSDIGDRTEKVATTCNPEGHWQTPSQNLRYFYLPVEGRCGTYSVTAKAEWNFGESLLSSNLFSGPPVPDYDDTINAVPITLTIDLGLSKFEANGIQVMGL